MSSLGNFTEIEDDKVMLPELKCFVGVVWFLDNFMFKHISGNWRTVFERRGTILMFKNVPCGAIKKQPCMCNCAYG